MAHKDWNGPGFYDCWDDSGEWIATQPLDHEGFLAESWTYKKLEDFKPPELPKPELEDGVYWVVHVNGKRTIMSLVEGKWFWSTGIKCLETPLTVLGKIPIDPI